jgi:hypothetical protein
MSDYVFLEYSQHGDFCGVAFPIPVLGRDDDSLIVDTSLEVQKRLPFPLAALSQVRLVMKDLDFQGYARQSTPRTDIPKLTIWYTTEAARKFFPLEEPAAVGPSIRLTPEGRKRFKPSRLEEECAKRIASPVRQTLIDEAPATVS